MSDRSVCVVTQPLSSVSETTVASFLEVVSVVATVSVITANLPDDSPIRENYEVDEVSGAGTGSSIVVAAVRYVLNQLRMCRALWARDEEIVVFFGPTSYLLPILVARLSGLTVVSFPRGDVPLTLRLTWEERLPAPVATALAMPVRIAEEAGFYLADAVVTYTPAMATELGLDRYERKLYPNGARFVDVDRFRPWIPFEDRDRKVGFLGRIDEEKGIRTLAAVARKLPDDVTFVFAGDGDLAGWLEEELADEIANGDVEFVGWVDHEDVPEQLSELRLLVMPSEPTEGLPTVILEAFGCGTPAYATPVSGIPDVVREGETGWHMTDETPEAIAEDVERILAREDLATISANCRELAVSEYSFEAAVERYRSILSAIEGG